MPENNTDDRTSKGMDINDLAELGLPGYYTKKNIIFGCGNILLGDDGFGPKVIEHFLANYEVPDDTYLQDVGTSIRNILFDLIIAEKRPENVVVVDAVDKERTPGEIFEIDVEGVPENKINDFSVHQIPTINMLKEIRDECGINVVILVCQVEHIPEEIQPGLTKTMESAIPGMCERLKEKIENFK